MTTVAETAEEQKKAAIAARTAAMDAEEKRLNEGKTGKGTRTFLSMTRGKNPQKIQYEQWDESQPDTLPTEVKEFCDLAGITSNEEMIKRLILGDNEIRYQEAADPTSEFVELTWPLDVQKQFKIVVKNYSNFKKNSIDDAVALIKPGFVASLGKK